MGIKLFALLSQIRFEDIRENNRDLYLSKERSGSDKGRLLHNSGSRRTYSGQP